MQFTSHMSVRICCDIILFAVQKQLSTLQLLQAHLSPRVPLFPLVLLFPPVLLSPPVPLFLPRVLRFPLVLIFARGNKRKKKRKNVKKEISACLINTGDLHRKWVTWQ